MSRLIRKIIGKILPNSRFGRSWFKQGDYITFKTEGFASAPSIPKLMARTYFEVLYIRQALETYVKQNGQLLSKSLEVGCGFGRLSPYIADFSKEHYAIDINKAALEDASPLYPHVHFLEASATNLPFEDNTFDCIITWTVLQHIMPNLIEDALSEINRCAKDSAVIILCEATRYAEKTLPNSHTQDRLEEFYLKAFSDRFLVTSTYFDEIDNIDGMATPGRFMVFFPRKH